MAGIDNLTPVKKGQVLNPNGRPKGALSKKTILNFLLFHADIDEMGIVKNKPDWWDKIKPKTIYEVMTLAQATKAMSGDTNAYKAINDAMKDYNIDGSTININFINKVPRPNDGYISTKSKSQSKAD